MLSEQFEEFFVEIVLSIIEAPFTFFEMEIKHMSWHPVELLQSSFGKAPKAFDAVDMSVAQSELVGTMIDSKVFGISHINESIVTPPSIAVNRRFGSNSSTNDGLECGFRAVGDDFGVDTTISFEQSENGRFASSSPTAFAPHATCTKIAFIDLNLTTFKRRFAFAGLSDASADLEVDCVHTFTLQARQNCHIRGGQVLSKQPH